MPYIDENHLVDLHKTIESKELQEQKLLSELKKQRVEKEKLNRSRNFLRFVSLGLFVVLTLGIALYFLKPSVYINERMLETHNKKLIEKGELNRFENEISLLNQKLLKQPLNSPDTKVTLIDTSLIYAVQVAAFEDKGISLYSNELKNISQYKDKPFNKYAIGNFTNLEDANLFRKEMVALGFKDVFVASYKNGKRIKIEEAF